MARKDSKTKLNENQKAFCHEYINDWNGSRSYKAAYPNCKTDAAARNNAVKLLTKTYIKDYIEEIKENIAEEVGISKVGMLKELNAIATADVSDMYVDWIELSKFKELKESHPTLMKAIKSIDTKTETVMRQVSEHDFEDVEVKYVKIQLHDKRGAISDIMKAMGWNAPKKLDITSNGESIKPVVDATLLGENTRKEILKAMQPKED